MIIRTGHGPDDEFVYLYGFVEVCCAVLASVKQSGTYCVLAIVLMLFEISRILITE